MSETQSKGSMNHNARVRSLSQSKIERMTEKEKEEWKNAISWFFLTDSIKRKIRLEIQSKLKIIDKNCVTIPIILFFVKFSVLDFF